jgi:hypothetical protein
MQCHTALTARREVAVEYKHVHPAIARAQVEVDLARPGEGLDQPVA